MNEFILTLEKLFADAKKSQFSLEKNIPVMLASIKGGSSAPSVISRTANLFLGHILKTTNKEEYENLDPKKLTDAFYEVVESQLLLHGAISPSDCAEQLKPAITYDPVPIRVNENPDVLTQTVLTQTEKEEDSSILKIIDRVLSHRELDDADNAIFRRIMLGLEGRDEKYQTRRCVNLADKIINVQDEQTTYKKMIEYIANQSFAFYTENTLLRESLSANGGRLFDAIYDPEIRCEFFNLEDVIQNLIALHVNKKTGAVINNSRFGRHYYLPIADMKETVTWQKLNNYIPVILEYIQAKWKCYAFAILTKDGLGIFVSSTEMKFNSQTKRIERNQTSPSISGHTGNEEFTKNSIVEGDVTASWNDFVKAALHELRDPKISFRKLFKVQ